MPVPSIGRIVHYTLSKQDVLVIGSQNRLGNHVSEGDVYPAVVVRKFDPSTTTLNLQVLLDGNDSYWATSRVEGEGPNTWAWPPRVEE
jgi:hypothetical protein